MPDDDIPCFFRLVCYTFIINCNARYKPLSQLDAVGVSKKSIIIKYLTLCGIVLYLEHNDLNEFRVVLKITTSY